MKLKINKACDLSSISVLPPQSRRSSFGANPMQSSQLRSQQSQQSFSQGPSSQPALFSQFSQSPLDDAVGVDQRFGSQGRENSSKKASYFPLTTYSREESQMQVSGSSNFRRKWNSNSVPEQRCQVSEQLEHRLGVIETSLSRFGMILDSIESDVMQVNKGTKEVLHETEGIRQELMHEDTSLKLLNRAQEDLKASIDGGMKSLADHVSRDSRDKLQQILGAVSTLPEKMEASLLRLQNEIRNTLTKEIQSFAINLKFLSPKSPVAVSLPNTHKLHNCCASPLIKLQPPKKISSSPAIPKKACGLSARSPKIEVGRWKSVRPTLSEKSLDKQKKQKRLSPTVQKTCHIIIESDHSDEEIDGLFSFLVDKEKTGTTNMSSEDTKRETEHILRRARRKRRKYSHTIIIS